MPTMPQEIARQWFVPGEGIDRHVISADIQRYLGNDATVRPGVGTGENQVSHIHCGHSDASDTNCIAGRARLLDQGVPEFDISVSHLPQDVVPSLTGTAGNDCGSARRLCTMEARAAPDWHKR